MDFSLENFKYVLFEENAMLFQVALKLECLLHQINHLCLYSSSSSTAKSQVNIFQLDFQNFPLLTLSQSIYAIKLPMSTEIQLESFYVYILSLFKGDDMISSLVVQSIFPFRL